VRLTPAGDRLRAYADETLSGWKRLHEDVAGDADEVGGEISVYCSVTASYAILPDILSAFRQHYPAVQIRLVTGDANVAVDRVMDGAVDISVAALPERLPAGIQTRIVTETPLVFIAARGAYPTGEVNWELTPMVLPESGLIRDYLQEWFRARGVVPRIYGEVSGHEGILSLVSLGMGVGVVPSLVLEKSLIQADVEVLDVSPALPNFRVGLCTKRSRLTSSAVRAFWETMDAE